MGTSMGTIPGTLNGTWHAIDTFDNETSANHAPKPAAAQDPPAAPAATVAIPSRHDVLLRSLTKFYASGDSLRQLTDLVRPGHRISLRILDWLCTNYAKKHNIVYLVPGEDDDGAPVTFNMFLQYKSQLKAYSKRYFDPFCRRDRLEFADADGGTIHTTVGQLNFFRWAITNGVIDYGAAHLADIERDMLRSIKHRGTDAPPPQEPKPKRRELSKAAIKGCTKTHVTVTVRFR